MDTEESGNMKTDNMELAELFIRTSRLMARSYHQQDRADHAQARVLSIIRDRGEINQRELMEILDVRSSSLSEILAKLERSGLISRKKNLEDRRGFTISATDSAGDESSARSENSANPEGPARLEKDRADYAELPVGADNNKESMAPTPFDCLDQLEKEQLSGILRKLILSLKDDTLCEGPLCRHHRHGGRNRDRRTGQGQGHGRRDGSNGRIRGGRNR